MNEQLITHKTAKLAKNVGFNLITDKIWVNYYTEEPLNKWKLIPFKEKTLSWLEWAAPTQSLLQKWLRDVHNIIVFVVPYPSSYNCVIEYYNRESKYSTDHYDTYEEALEEGLYKALDLVNL